MTNENIIIYSPSFFEAELAGVFSARIVQPDVYARHVIDPGLSGGVEPFGPELKAEGLMGCPFVPAQGEGSPLYVNPVNMLIILAKVLAEGKRLRPSGFRRRRRLWRDKMAAQEGGTERHRRELSRT